MEMTKNGGRHSFQCSKGTEFTRSSSFPTWMCSKLFQIANSPHAARIDLLEPISTDFAPCRNGGRVVQPLAFLPPSAAEILEVMLAE